MKDLRVTVEGRPAGDVQHVHYVLAITAALEGPFGLFGITCTRNYRTCGHELNILPCP